MRFMRFPITKIIWSVIRFMCFGMHLFSLIIREMSCPQYFTILPQKILSSKLLQVVIGEAKKYFQ